MIRLILEAVKEWVEELLNGFVKKGNAEDSKSITGRYNVLDYGLKGDGTTDNTVALQNMINSVPAGAVIFFPIGVYNITDTIECPKSVSFVGESYDTQRMIGSNTRVPDSQINYVGNKSNITLFKHLNQVRFYARGLAFFGNSYAIKDNSEAFTTLPYHRFVDEILENRENINCIDYVEGGVVVRDCMFNGFSGYGLKIGQHNYVKNCGFYKCNVGVIQDKFDSLIENCWFSKCTNAIVCDDPTHSFTNLSVNDCWCDQVIEHFIKVKCASNATCMLLVNDAWVDMIDGSAIYVEGTLNKAQINGRFSRCGMMYAGITADNRTNSVKPFADIICANAIKDSNINVIAHKRSIGSGGNANGICPSRVVSALTDSIEYCSVHSIDSYMSDIMDNVEQVLNTKVYGKDNNAVEHKGGTFDISHIIYRTSTPIGAVKAPKRNTLCIDTTSKKIYIATAGDNNTSWELLDSPDPTDIDFSDIEGV